jgi:AcrR family transcriptional regulator
MTAATQATEMISDAPILSDLARQRRAQIVEAALAIIAEQGLQKLSLANLEKRVEMTRGHLTYYFPTKEAILLSVLDRMVERIIARHESAGAPRPGVAPMAEVLPRVFAEFLAPMTPERAAFLSLLQTFKAQAGYREDVRKRLSDLEADFRRRIAADYAATVPAPQPLLPDVFATILFSVLTGLDGQLATNPQALDREATLQGLTAVFAPLCVSEPSPIGAVP